MAQKNLMAQVAGFLKRTTTGELPAPELALLSEEALQQIVGGGKSVVDPGRTLSEAEKAAREIERQNIVRVLNGQTPIRT
jgi:hypothetical protein